MFYTHRSKSQVNVILNQTINIIVTQFQRKIVFIRSDDEILLKNKFFSMLTNKGISFKSTAPDIQAQNKHFERKNDVLLIKVRTLRIDADLPHYF